MTQDNESDNLTYRDAGVDIDAGNELVERIKPTIQKTRRPGVMGSIGGFGGLFELPWKDYDAPILVSGTDGVGTKLRLAIDANRHDFIGIDLVAMCVNDIVVTGAEPLFFLDYYATGKLDIDIATQVVEGIGTGCVQAGAALIGGETAEMPGMYSDNDYDLAGFAVGLVEKSRVISGDKVQPGDVMIGLASSGPHSNGYSLIRRVLARAGNQQPEHVTDPLGNKQVSVIDALLAPTRIYVKSILSVLKNHEIHALAHITGGGLSENIPRVLQPGMIAQIDVNSWQQPEIFDWLQSTGNIAVDEMRRVFNCGIGMVAIVSRDNAVNVLNAFSDAGEQAWQIGTIERNEQSDTLAADVRFA